MIKEAVTRADILKQEVESVMMGTVLQGGQGQIPSRQAAVKAGLPWEVSTETINKVCASGLRSVTLADQIIRTGDEEIVVAGGMESMSNAPYFLRDARFGMVMGNTPLKDLMLEDGLTCSFTGSHMGVHGERIAKELQISRDEQDRWALRSQLRAITAMQTKVFSEEIIPVQVQDRKGERVLITEDENPRKIQL